MYERMNSKELKDLRSFLQLDSEKFKEELSAIDQELTLRNIPDCLPLADLLDLKDHE